MIYLVSVGKKHRLATFGGKIFWDPKCLPKMSPEQEFGTTNQVENGFNCWLCLNHFIKIGIWLQLTCRTQPLRSRAGNIPRNPKTTQKASKKHTCVTCQQITFWHCVSPQTARSWWLTSLRRSKKIKKQDKVLNHCSTCSARAWVFWNHYPRPKSPKALASTSCFQQEALKTWENLHKEALRVWESLRHNSLQSWWPAQSSIPSDRRSSQLR